MLELSLLLNHRSTPPFPDTPPAELETWNQNDGTACAFGCVRDGQHWMLLPGVASFCFERTGPQVKAFPFPNVGEDLIRDNYMRCVMPIAVQVQGQEVLHASAVRHPRGVVVFCAVSEIGKSTIAYGLSRRGYSLLADDAVAFDITDNLRSRFIPLPFSIHLRPSSSAYFGVDDQSNWNPAKRETAEETASQPLPLAAMFVLRRAPDSSHPDAFIKSSRLSPNEAFAALLPHAYCFGLREIDRKRLMLQQYLLAAQHIPVFDFYFPAGLERLPAIFDAIEKAVGSTNWDDAILE